MICTKSLKRQELKSKYLKNLTRKNYQTKTSIDSFLQSTGSSLSILFLNKDKSIFTFLKTVFLKTTITFWLIQLSFVFTSEFMVKTYESRIPPSPNLDKVTVSSDKFIVRRFYRVLYVFFVSN